MSRADGAGRIGVLLVDDHTLFREGLAEIFAVAEDLRVVGEAGNGREAVVLAREKRPDIVLLDVEMPVMGAEEALGGILEGSPSSKVVILTMHDDARLARELLTRGASAYLLKNASREQLLAAVRSIAAGEGGAILSLSRAAIGRLEDRRSSPLSERQREILVLAGRGMSNRQIAYSLHLSESTIQRHLSNIYSRLRVGSRSEATRKALSEGWITPRDVIGRSR